MIRKLLCKLGFHKFVKHPKYCRNKICNWRKIGYLGYCQYCAVLPNEPTICKHCGLIKIPYISERYKTDTQNNLRITDE